MDTLLTAEEAAKLLNVQVTTVRQWLREGKLRGRKLGRIWRVSRSDLLRVAEQGHESDGECAQ